MNIKFKKIGLSPDDIQQMKNYGILPDKRTLQSLSRAYNSINPSIEDIIEFQDKLGFKVDTDYVDFLLRNNGGVPSKVRIKGNKIVIDHFLSFKSDYKLNSIIDIYSDFQQYGLPMQKLLLEIVLFCPQMGKFVFLIIILILLMKKLVWLQIIFWNCLRNYISKLWLVETFNPYIECVH